MCGQDEECDFKLIDFFEYLRLRRPSIDVQKKLNSLFLRNKLDEKEIMADLILYEKELKKKFKDPFAGPIYPTELERIILGLSSFKIPSCKCELYFNQVKKKFKKS